MHCFKKMQMGVDHKPSAKFVGDVKLIRATESGINRSSLIDIANDYELKSVVNGSVDIVLMEGGHKSFMATNGKEIGEAVELFFTSIACA